MPKSKSELVQKFEEVRAQIASKMEEAAKQINAANKLLKDSKLAVDTYGNITTTKGSSPLFLGDYEFYNETKILLKAIDLAGWSSSSMKC